MSKNKNTKQAKLPAVVSVRPTSISARLSSSRGRIVGVTTVSGNKVRKFNGQIKSVGQKFVSMYDRNQRKQVKFALSSVMTVTGV